MTEGFETNPLVSFERGGQVLPLGRFPLEDDVLHLHGSTGLGLPPVSHATVERANGHGVHLRGSRYQAREVFIPLWVQKRSKAELTAYRRQLYRLLAPHLGPVTIRVQDPATGTDRTIQGVLKEGLEGNFGDDFDAVSQSFGLTFLCPDPYWSGPEHVLELKVNPGVKPFISQTVPFFPVILAQSTVQGQFTVQVEGDAPISPTWRITGPGSDLVISRGRERFELNHTWNPGGVLTIDTEKRRMSPDLWNKVPLSSRLFDLQPGNNQLNVSMVAATTQTKVEMIYAEKYLEAI